MWSGHGVRGRPQPLQDPQGKKQPAWGSMRWVQAQLQPKPQLQGPVMPVVWGLGLLGVCGGTSPLSTELRGATGFLPLRSQNLALTRSLDTLSPPEGEEALHTPACFCCGCSSRLLALGKRWWPGLAARCGQGQLCLNTLRCWSSRALGLHARNGWRTSPAAWGGGPGQPRSAQGCSCCSLGACSSAKTLPQQPRGWGLRQSCPQAPPAAAGMWHMAAQTAQNSDVAHAGCGRRWDRTAKGGLAPSTSQCSSSQGGSISKAGALPLWGCFS